MGAVIDLVNQTYGKLTVVAFDRTEKKKSYWKCKCECGNETIARADHLKRGQRTSCGCTINYHKKHGLWQTVEYRTLTAMIQRCTNPKCKPYPDYGGRGIKVCERWMNDRATFVEDVGLRPSPNHTIERIDNNGNYEPGNVRWATRKEQLVNTRRNHYVMYKGERMTISEVAEIENINYDRLSPRIRRGMSPEEAVKECLEREPNHRKYGKKEIERALELLKVYGPGKVRVMTGISLPYLTKLKRDMLNGHH